MRDLTRLLLVEAYKECIKDKVFENDNYEDCNFEIEHRIHDVYKFMNVVKEFRFSEE